MVDQDTPEDKILKLQRQNDSLKIKAIKIEKERDEYKQRMEELEKRLKVKEEQLSESQRLIQGMENVVDIDINKDMIEQQKTVEILREKNKKFLKDTKNNNESIKKIRGKLTLLRETMDLFDKV